MNGCGAASVLACVKNPLVAGLVPGIAGRFKPSTVFGRGLFAAKVLSVALIPVIKMVIVGAVAFGGILLGKNLRKRHDEKNS